MNEIKISVIMPAYNASKYIAQSIESVINQSYSNWEIVIVDDCSTDNTTEIIEKYRQRDERIVYKRLPQNTGACYIPREEAAYLSTGDFFLLLDSDDYIEHDFIQKAIKRQEETEADTILGTMYIVSENGDFIGKTKPSSDYAFNAVLSGKEAFCQTIPWKIGLNGIIVRKHCFIDALKQNSSFFKGVYGDELCVRRCLLNSSKVAFSEARYNYRLNPHSLVHSFSPKIFHMYDAYKDVKKVCRSEFPDDVRMQTNAERYLLSGLNYAFSQYLRGKQSLSSRQKIEYLKKFKEWYDSINFTSIQPKYRQETLFAIGFEAYYYLRSTNFILKKWCHLLRK